MKQLLKHIACLTTVILLTACGKEKNSQVEADPIPVGGSCSSSVLGACYNFLGAKNAEDSTKIINGFACALLGGSLTDGVACESGSNLVGRCLVLAGEPLEYSLLYYDDKWNTDSAQQDCANDASGIHSQGAGVWTPN